MSCPYHKEPDYRVPPPEETIDGPGEPIPHPPEHWFLGNIPDVDSSWFENSLTQLAKVYGPIFSLNLVNRRVVVVSSQELANEVSQEPRFSKGIRGTIEDLRELAGNGLFTGYPDEHEWWISRRMLLPSFGPFQIQAMFPKMMDILSQMVLRWDRFGPDNKILVMAFDTIGITAFNYRFNQFYSNEPHPFQRQMTYVLTETALRRGRLSIENTLYYSKRKEMLADIQAMWKLCDEIVAERKAHPKPEVNDLLNTMLYHKDAKTGEGLSDELIRFQMVTFLIAGHETTSGTMGFLFYYLLSNPETLRKAYQEVDEVVGGNAVELSHLPKLKYLQAAIRETLRMRPPIPTISRLHVGPGDFMLGGKYKVQAGTIIMIALRALHVDPAVWGDDGDKFRPERFLDGGWENLPPHAWKPFGQGARSCIGRGLAEQEMLIATTLILARFVVEKVDPSYQLRIRSALTVKSDEFYIKVRRRPGTEDMVGIPGAPRVGEAARAKPDAETNGKHPGTERENNDNLKRLAIYYGSNTGTCKSFAEDIQTSAPDYGFQATTEPLDSAVESLPKDIPVLIITSSYEGQPPMNAGGFVCWLQGHSEQADLLQGVSYSVLGVGNSEWINTFHRIPKLVDTLMSQVGAKRLHPIGLVDVKEDIMGAFENWKAGMFPAIRKAFDATSEIKRDEIKVQIVPPDTPSKLAGEEISTALVTVNKEIAKRNDSSPQKKHLEVLLPPGSTYQSGDYLVVLPFNPMSNVTRVLRRFNVHADDLVNISGTKKAHLLGGAISVFDLLSCRVELSTPASQRQIAHLASITPGADGEKLKALASDESYHSEILEKRVSLLDLLEDFPQCELSFGAYLDLLPPLAPRQYSISSSPLANSLGSSKTQERETPVASITYDVFDFAALSGKGRTFKGVASTFLASLSPGSSFRCFVRPTNVGFRLPSSPLTPIIMIATGTGIAPMHGFLQERAAFASARGAGALGTAILYFGCRDHEVDFLYKDELMAWEAAGVVRVRACFSRNAPDGQKTMYVPDAIWEDREELAELFKHQGAKIFVCGSASKLGRSSADAVVRVYRDSTGKNEEEAQEWLAGIREERYVSDVFG